MTNCTDQKPLRIAQVVGNATSGGVPSCVMNFLRHTDHSRFVYDFYTYGPSAIDEEVRACGGQVYYIPPLYHAPKADKLLRHLFEQGHYDIVHAHNTTLSVVVLHAAKKAKVGVRICHAHNTAAHEKTAVVKYALRPFAPLYATHLAGCSHYSNLWLYGPKRGEQAFVLRNAIDLDRFAANEAVRQGLRSKLGIGDNFVVGHVGRWEYQKNIPFVLQMFGALHAVCPRAVLVLVGSGSMEQAIRDQIAAMDLMDWVHMVPETDRAQDYYNAFDLFVLPSHYEGLPLVLVEAQAVGVPCLVSQAVTPEANVTGHLTYLPLDPQVWVQEALWHCEHPVHYEDREAVAEAGYDIRREVARLEEFYTQAVQQ